MPVDQGCRTLFVDRGMGTNFVFLYKNRKKITAIKMFIEKCCFVKLPVKSLVWLLCVIMEPLNNPTLGAFVDA